MIANKILRKCLFMFVKMAIAKMKSATKTGMIKNPAPFNVKLIPKFMNNHIKIGATTKLTGFSSLKK